MQMFSRFCVLCFCVVLLYAGGTLDVYAQGPALLVSGDRDETYQVNDTVKIGFIALDGRGNRIKGVSLTITHSGLMDVVISNGGTTDFLGQVTVAGKIIADTNVYIQAEWPDRQLRARFEPPVIRNVAQNPYLEVVGSQESNGILKVTFQAGFDGSGQSEISLQITATPNIKITSPTPVPGTHTTGPGGFLTVTGTLQRVNAPTHIEAVWDLPSGSQLFARADGPSPATTAEAVFDRYANIFQHPDVHKHFPGVLHSFKNPDIQNVLNSLVIHHFVRDPKSIRTFYPEIDDSILVLLLLDDEFQTLFRDPQFHAVLQDPREIDELVSLIEATTPHPSGDPTCPLPPLPNPPTPTTLNIVSGNNNQLGEVGKPLVQPFIVGVLDQEGKPLQGVQVTFSVTPRNGRLSETGDITDVYGQVRTTLTLGDRAGRYSVTARAAGITQTQTFTATAVASPPKEPEPKPVVSMPLMYWIEEGHLYRFSGSGKEKVPSVGNVVSFTVDAEGGKLYWATETGEIHRANLDGTVPNQLIKWGDGNIVNIAINPSEDELYVTNIWNEIRRVIPNPKNPTIWGHDIIYKGLRSPRYIALGGSPNRIYWTEIDPDGWLIRFASLPGGQNGNRLPRLFKRGLDPLEGLAVVGDKVYWTETIVGGSKRVSCANLNGSGETTVKELESITLGLAFDTNGSNLYWTTPQGGLQSLDLIALGNAPAAPSSEVAPSLSPVASVVSALLANYPNPFNPETWIPYQLSASADVSVSIYSVNGHLVRRLDLGHQSAGVYQSRSRAAYWDGRNTFGERVASGLYFYTLTAGDFTATRKMLIRK